jgi:hypothetical protein
MDSTPRKRRRIPPAIANSPGPNSIMLAGSGVVVGDPTAEKSPDSGEVVMIFPEAKSADVHVALGQKYSWIF